MSDVEWAKSSGLQGVMTNVLSHVAEYSPARAVEHFEMLLKNSNLKDVVETVQPDDSVLNRAKHAAKLFQRPVPPVPLPEPAEGEEPKEFKPDPDTVDGENDGKVDDVIGDMQVLQHAGVGLGQEQTFRLYASLKKLAKSKPAEQVHFFGIIRGSKQDYYIAEVSHKERDAGPGDEPKGEGEEAPAAAVDAAFPPREDGASGEPDTWLVNPNQYVYFVCHSPGPAALWRRLPDVLPKHITLSRRLRRIFTGDLSAPVLDVVPPFPGTEAHLLRAQIARIRHGVSAGVHLFSVLLCSCACGCSDCLQASVTVKGILSFTPGEAGEEGSVAKGEDPKPIAANEMSVLHLGNWLHAAKEILPQGRCSFITWPPAPEGEEEDESAGKAAKYVEVNAQPLRSIHLDSSEGRQLWSTSNSNGKAAVAIARSNVWPGAAAAYNGKRVVNIYIGFGLKSGRASGVSPVTPAIQVRHLS